MTHPDEETPLVGRPTDEFIRLVPHDFARRHLILSAGQRDETELLRVSDQTSLAPILNTRARIGRRVETTVEDADGLARDIDSAYASSRTPERGAECAAESNETTGDDLEGLLTGESRLDLDSLIREAESDLLATSGKAPIVRLVDAAIFDAIGRDASDLHVQPLEDRVLIRYRVDGTLTTVRELPPSFLQPIISRVKVMGGMDIAERREPQDGRATVTIGRGPSKRSIDLRVSSIPTACGERVVLRVLDQSRSERLQTFGQLGMPDDTRSAYTRLCDRSHGLILVTGPTGSGKSTTLYATLRWISSGRRGSVAGGSDTGTTLNIMTIEDPIEFSLAAAGFEISQSQVNNRKGVTFATGLRHVLRQDPDVIMVGEIRDTETARLAIQAALTGHLVFSTLHTNDAASAVTRLLDLGVEPFLVGSSVTAVLAQRLVRKVHLACGGSGCQGCLGTGYAGRTGIYELLRVDHGVRALIAECASSAAIADAAVASGMRTLASDGRRLVERGETTEQELARVTASDTVVSEVLV